MDLLLDTHTLIWVLNGDKKLSTKVRREIEKSENVKIVSIGSVWEIAIKMSLDKFRFSKGLKNFLNMVEKNGFELLPITFEHTIILSTLEFIHRGPFDRLLISQCIADKLTIATRDENIKRYDIQTM